MSEPVVASGARSLRRGDVVATVTLAVIAVTGNVLPHQLAPETAAIQRALGLDAVPWPVQSALAAVLVLAAVLIACLGGRRLTPLFLIAGVLWLVRGTGTELFIASYCAGAAYRRIQPLAAFLVAAAVVLVLPTVLTGSTTGLLEGVGGAGGLFVLAPVLLGLWVGARRQVLEGLHAHAEQQEREQRMLAESAREQERAKIARDMHDVVAHRVSLMVLYAGALEAQAADGKQAESAALIRTTGREALAQLRQVLGVLREPAAPSPAPLPALSEVDDLLAGSRAAGIPLHRVDEGEPGELPVVVQHAAYRVLQEALTNVHKHAGAVPTEVRLRHLPDGLEVQVHNAAPGRPVPPLPGTGSGLLGLRERVRVLGGTFDAQPSLDGGFLVTAWLPVTGE